MTKSIFIPSPKIVGVSLDSIFEDLTEANDALDLNIEITRSNISNKLGQEYVDKLYILKDDMIDEDEEDVVEARHNLAANMIKKYMK